MRILIGLLDILPSLPLSSAYTTSTLPHCLKVIWLMKDLCPKLVEDTYFFWKGLPHDAGRMHGVGFTIQSSLLAHITESPVGINERLMILHLPLIKGRFMTVVSAYALTLVSDETTKDSFYSCLLATLQAVPRNDRLGDFNARVGTNHVWSDVIGKHGLGNANSNGLLLNLCSEFGFVITNTLFRQRNQRKATWMHPRSKHWHMLDYVITRSCDVADVHLTCVMRGAECWMDHRVVVSKFQLKLRPIRKQRPQKRLNVRACKDPATQENLQKKMSDLLQNSTDDSMSYVTDCHPSRMNGLLSAAPLCS